MSASHPHPEPAWVHRHPHEPNPVAPAGDGALRVFLPDGALRTVAVAALQQMPAITVAGCFIVSTGHGASGPFAFTGVALYTFLGQVLPAGLIWRHVDVVGADGFGARLLSADLALSPRPPLLAYASDGAALTRGQGLVRLIVPAETEDALFQVKWVSEIRIAPGEAAA